MKIIKLQTIKEKNVSILCYKCFILKKKEKNRKNPFTCYYLPLP